MGIRADGSAVREITYLPESMRAHAAENALAERATRQLAAYFADPSFVFDLPLATTGSAFQRRVWTVIGAIPAGRVASYGKLAQRLGSAPRAVGQACGANYFLIVIPCHRVVSSTGIGGFANQDSEGFFRAIKRWLLAHEGVHYA